MTRRFFNGLQIDVPEGWADLSTVILAPKKEVTDGQRPTINLVVKRRPAKGKSREDTLNEYLTFMRQSFGVLDDLETKEMLVGSVKAKVVRFSTSANGKRFRQMTMLYQLAGDEVSATVTQLEGDPTPVDEIEDLLLSIKPAGPGVFGIK